MKNATKRWLLQHLKDVMTILLLFFVMACSDDGEDAPEITLGQLSSEYEGNCNHGSGFTGADYAISIPYSGTDNDSLSSLLYTITVEGGPTQEAQSNFNDFALTDGGGTFTWNGCFLFLDADWIDIEVRVETADGSISSTASIRLNRTDFDN